MAAVLDEALGGACWMNGHRTVAAKISVSFIAMLKLESETTVESRVDRVEGRKIYLRATLSDASGAVIAESDGLFIVLREEALQKL